jgi:hypothetical protein
MRPFKLGGFALALTFAAGFGAASAQDKTDDHKNGTGTTGTPNGTTTGATTNGGANGTSGTANGGTANGGTANGGTANGGTANGGTANGGTANGGTANGLPPVSPTNPTPNVPPPPGDGWKPNGKGGYMRMYSAGGVMRVEQVGPGTGFIYQNGQVVPDPTPLSPAVENAIRGTPMGKVGQVVKGVWRDATDPMQSGTFIGGIAINDAANAGLHGLEGNTTWSDEYRDLGHALTTPEFYAGVGVFNAVYPKAEATAGRLGFNFIEAATQDEGAGLLTRIAGKAAGAAKRNIALGLTMTVLQLVKPDFNGFNLLTEGKQFGNGLLNTVETGWKDGTTLLKDTFHPSKWGSDFASGFSDFVNGWSPFGHETAKLAGTRIHFGSIPMVKEKWCPFPLPEDLIITLGSFAAAGPLWSAIKWGGMTFLKRFLIAEAAEHTVMGPIEVGELLVPGGGEVADAAEEAGQGIGALGYAIVMGAIDLGGLLFTANKIQGYVQDKNDERIFQDKARDAMNNYLNVTQENNGNPDQKKLQEAMSQLATAMADLRDYHYLPVAIEDAKFVDRLKRDGVPQSEINAVGQTVMAQDGAWLAAPGQTAQLEQAFAPGTKHPGANMGDVNDLVARHDAEVQKLLSGIDGSEKEFKLPDGTTTKITGNITAENADPNNKNAKIFTITNGNQTQQVTATDYRPVNGGIWESQLDPNNKDFGFSGSRDQLYDQEIAILVRGGQNLSNAPITIQQKQPDGSIQNVETTRQKLVLQDMQIVGGLASAEQQLLQPLAAKSQGFTNALPNH